MNKTNNILLCIFIFGISILVSIYFAIQNPITHAHFYVVVDGGTTSLTSISPQGDKTSIQSEDKNSNSFFWGSKKNQLLDIAYFIINTDIDKLQKVTIYQEKNRLLASYNKKEFLEKWDKIEQGYKVPTGIVIHHSLLPKINKIINWKGDMYIIPIIFLICFQIALILVALHYLLKKNNDINHILNSFKLYIISNKSSIFQELLFSYLLITIAFIGLAFLNQPFVDDFYRIPNSNNGWLQDGRYIMHFAYQLLTVNTNRAIAIATPYTYFLSTAFLALANLILARYFNRKNIYISLVISSFIVLLPFYYGNMIYQHERVMMAFSLLLALSLALFSFNLNYKTSFVITFLGVSILFLIYQPMLVHYILMISFLFLLSLITNNGNFKKTFIWLFAIISSFLIAMILYKINDKVLFNIYKSHYAVYASSIKNHPDIIDRLKDLANILYNQWQDSFLGYAIVLILPAFIVILVKNFIKTKPNLLVSMLFIISLVVIVLSPSLIHLLSTLHLKYRFISGINLLITISLLYIYNYSKNIYLHRASIILSILLLMNALASSSYLYNCMQVIAQYQQELKTHLKEDLYQYSKAGGDINNLACSNSLNIVKTLDDPAKPRYLPAIYDILSADHNFSMANSMGFPELVHIQNLAHSKLKNLAYNEIVDRRYYSIRYYQSLNRVVVDFK